MEAAPIILAAAAAFGALHGLLARAMSGYSWYASKGPADRAYAAQSAVSILASAIIGALYAEALGQLPATLEARHFETTPTHTLGISINIGLCVYEIVLYVAHGKPVQFWAHHVLSLCALGSGVVTGHMCQLLAWEGLVELTNIPLCTVTLMQNVPRLKASGAYVVAGASLWLAFLALRVVSLGWCAATIAHDLFVALPAAGRLEELHPLQRYLVLPGTAFLWLLSGA